jgi:plasmid stabilization system protein ParE
VRRLIWSPRALALYERDVLDHLAKQGPRALQRVRRDIERAVEGLALRATGRPGRVTGTYEKSVTGQPYVIAYALVPRDNGGEDDLVILRIVHTARDWPPGRWPR